MKLLTIVALAGLVLLILEGISWAIAGLSASILTMPIPNRGKFMADQSRQLDRLLHGTPFRSKLHAVRGWEHNSGRIAEGETMNAQGLRAQREYAPEPVPGLTRVAAFGDSYVYCAEAADADAWPRQIETRWKAEVLNYGVGGYSADQAWLRYGEDGARLKPRIVVIGFTTMMATRIVSRYRRFQNPRDGVLFKPRFILEGDKLRLVPTPVPSREDAERLLADPAKVVEFGRNDFWYLPAVFEHWLYPRSATYRLFAYASFRIRRRYFHPDRIHKGHTLNPEAESFRILVRLFQDFVAAVERDKAEPVALMLPTRSDLELYGRFGEASYQTFRTRLEGLGIRVIDPISAFPSPPPLDELFTPGGHYAPKGNTVIAEAVAKALGLPLKA